MAEACRKRYGNDDREILGSRRRSVFLHEGDYTAHTKLAVWFGSEATGISDLAVERSEMCVSIPMFGMIESLNLGTSSGIVLYEVARHRSS